MFVSLPRALPGAELSWPLRGGVRMRNFKKRERGGWPFTAGRGNSYGDLRAEGGSCPTVPCLDRRTLGVWRDAARVASAQRLHEDQRGPLRWKSVEASRPWRPRMAN